MPILLPPPQNHVHEIQEKIAYKRTDTTPGSTQWAWAIKDEYPEIEYLAEKDVDKTHDVKNSATWSLEIYKDPRIEFDRTLMTLLCLHYLTDPEKSKAYALLSQNQPNEKRISLKSFLQARLQVNNLIKALQKYGLSQHESIKLIEVGLLLGDLGKSPTAKAKFPNAIAADHDIWYGQMIEELKSIPSKSQSYASLSQKARELLHKASKLAHYGHIVHLEGDSSMFDKVHTFKNSSDESAQLVLALDTTLHLLDVMGADGNRDNISSRRLIEETWTALKISYGACLKKNSEASYKYCLRQRGKLLGLTKKGDIPLVKMGCMMRLFTKEAGEQLKNAFSKLPSSEQKKIHSYYGVVTSKNWVETPTYAPALLGKFSPEKAVQKALPFIIKTLELRDKMIQEGIDALKTTPVNFNDIAGLAGENPEILEGAIPTINVETGKVGVKHDSLFTGLGINHS